MKLATGNDLRSGDVLWWDGQGWSRQIADAVDVGTHGLALIAEEEAARRVNVPYLVDAEPGPDGPRPAHIKDRIRARGPTVRGDLARAPADPGAGSWVI
ncbi:DUF2849 domain-containing protein [Sphingomonas morindae]|uniref:DUF2849 domain-containing protein n=1 Tax=Sphingomonas morindae TaxID=1541170 RepID=A0ABY4X885_9SPHN|nr:DUF2849 domain-containing protein [Sphingomonas morindae]USI73121.1 DUF2849 domain-containing protein [Sphingomonas morindae]